MANKRKCRNCSEYSKPDDMFIVNIMAFCDYKCASKYSLNILPGYKHKVKEEQEKKVRIQNKKRKQDSMPRSYWYARLQKLVNQWVCKVRDKDKPCFTCGKTDPSVKYDAGHRYHAGGGGGDKRRFILTNINRQCSVSCNVYGSGMPAEYDIALDKEYGEGTAEWLKIEVNHPSLKEQFPHIDDIKEEMDKYRKLLRDNGLRPVE